MFRLVVIDDEYIVVEGIKAIIEKKKMNCEVVGSANDGVTGLRVIQEQRPDMVITDIRMPGMDGLSLIETVKEEFPDILFIVISGFTEFEYARRALHLGVKSYIDKPVTIEKIQEAILKIEQERDQQSNQYLLQKKEADALIDQMISNIIQCNAQNLNDNGQQYLNQFMDEAKINTYKLDCFQVLCVLLEVIADQKRTHENWMYISYRDLEELETVKELKNFAINVIGSIAANLEAEAVGSSHRTVQQLLQFINQNYNKDIGLNELAEQVNMNPNYLSILFKEEVGMSYIKYLTNLRIQKSKDLLLQGGKVSDVAEQVGYNNYRHFCETFKKYVGQTPNEYKGCIRKR